MHNSISINRKTARLTHEGHMHTSDRLASPSPGVEATTGAGPEAAAAARRLLGRRSSPKAAAEGHLLTPLASEAEAFLTLCLGCCCWAGMLSGLKYTIPLESSSSPETSGCCRDPYTCRKLDPGKHENRP